MGTPTWSDVMDLFAVDEQLSVYVFGTTVEDWEKVIAAVGSQGWQVGFTSIGRPTPPAVRELFARADALSVRLSIQPAAGIFLTTSFSTADEIEFELNPQAVRGQADLDALCTFLRLVARAADKPIALVPERHRILLGYDPRTDAFVVRPGR